MSEPSEYPCPDCGFEGPHVVFLPESPDEPTVIECGDSECGGEFYLPTAAS